MSHFSTVKTELRQLDPLLKALNDLGFTPSCGNHEIRGYKGQTILSEIAVFLDKGGDIGFRFNKETCSYELVTDLDLWKQNIPIELFLSKLTQKYALNSVLYASQKEGFEVSEQKNLEDGSIELVVTRWDN